MTEPIGHRRWAIADGYIPSRSHGPKPGMESHESCCILNAGSADATVRITFFFSDRDPLGPYRFTVPARRNHHLRVSDFNDPAPIPKDTPYALVVESDVPVVVQHTRLDTQQAENALMTAIGYAG